MAIRILAVLLATAALAPVDGPTTLLKSGPEIGIDGQSGWTYYANPADGPGGGYFGWLSLTYSPAARNEKGRLARALL